MMGAFSSYEIVLILILLITPPVLAVRDLRERQDMVNDGGYSDKIVSNAPEKIDDTFTVPKVIE